MKVEISAFEFFVTKFNKFATKLLTSFSFAGELQTKISNTQGSKCTYYGYFQSA